MDISLSQIEQLGSEAVTGAVDFGQGLLHSLERPVLGFRQLEAQDLSHELNSGSDSRGAAGAFGELVGSAVLFYGTTTITKAIPRAGKLAPIVAGAVLGFLDPVKDNTLNEHLINAVRGATTVSIMEKFPDYFMRNGFKGDLFGNLSNVALTGALAGIADVNIHSLLTTRSFVPLSMSAEAAGSWAMVGSVFHLGSLKLSKPYQSCADRDSIEVMLLGSPTSAEHFQTREFLNSLSPMGVKYRIMGWTGRLYGRSCESLSPTVVFPDGSRISGTDFSGLAAKLKLPTTPRYSRYRVAVIGAGPAGTQAAITAASELPEGQPVSIIAEMFGGQARFTTSIKNLMGFFDITGNALMVGGLTGARARGAELIHNRVESIADRQGTKVLKLRDGSEIEADAVVVATGMRYNQLAADGMDALTGRGVYTLADANETQVMAGKDVGIVGAGNSAGQAAIGFSRYARNVHLLVRGPSLRKSMSEYLIREIAARPSIHVHLNTEVDAVLGQDKLDRMVISTKRVNHVRLPDTAGLQNGPKGNGLAVDGTEGERTLRVKDKVREVPVDAMYVYIGGRPNTSFLHGSGIAVNEKGFVLTGPDAQSSGRWTAERPPYQYETSMPGVFAVGDVNAGSPQKRIASAIGDGAKFAGSLHPYLNQVPVSSTVPLEAAKPIPRSLFHMKLPTLAAGFLNILDDKVFAGI